MPLTMSLFDAPDEEFASTDELASTTLDGAGDELQGPLELEQEPE